MTLNEKSLLHYYTFLINFFHLTSIFLIYSEYNKAILDYTLALEIDPKNANALHNRGSSSEKAGNLNDALSDFTLALQLGPDNASSYNSRGLTLDKLGRRGEAIADFGRAIGEYLSEGASIA